ncbi:MAG: hypothetical protein PHZ00_05160 [Candidatus Peribacteraceae bacterium]|nr:hypothetical protein [Candidatus Peribacteraceae bacterium]
MELRSTLLAGTLAVIIGIPLAAGQVTIQSDMPPPVYRTSTIPQGVLTRGQFIDVLATRLFDVDSHNTCFRDLVGYQAPEYTLLFSDVSLDHPIASSVCVMMRSHLARGSSNMLHPNQRISAAEAAAIFSRLSTDIRNAHANEQWYEPYMETMRSMDPQFTFRPWDTITGSDLRDMMCVLKRNTPELDPHGELTGC